VIERQFNRLAAKTSRAAFDIERPAALNVPWEIGGISQNIGNLNGELRRCITAIQFAKHCSGTVCSIQYFSIVKRYGCCHCPGATAQRIRVVFVGDLTGS
jgi:hypothetical protein